MEFIIKPPPVKEAPRHLKMKFIPPGEFHPKLKRVRFEFDLSIGHCFYEMYVYPEMINDPKMFSSYCWSMVKKWINRNL